MPYVLEACKKIAEENIKEARERLEETRNVWLYLLEHEHEDWGLSFYPKGYEEKPLEFIWQIAVYLGSGKSKKFCRAFGERRKKLHEHFKTLHFSLRLNLEELKKKAVYFEAIGNKEVAGYFENKYNELLEICGLTQKEFEEGRAFASSSDILAKGEAERIKKALGEERKRGEMERLKAKCPVCGGLLDFNPHPTMHLWHCRNCIRYLRVGEEIK